MASRQGRPSERARAEKCALSFPVAAVAVESAAIQASWSRSALRMSVATEAGCASCSLKILSITWTEGRASAWRGEAAMPRCQPVSCRPACRRDPQSRTCISVAVVSTPHTAHQSFTTIPAPITSDPRLTVPATTGSCSSDDSSSWSSTAVLGWTKHPLLESTAYDPTSALPAIVCRNTSTPSTSAMISSVSRSSSVCTSATWSLVATTLPRAERRSSTRWIKTPSGRELRKCSNSWSVVVEGTISPFLFPTVTLPTILVPPIEVCTTGMCSAISASKTEKKFWEPPRAVRQ
mmetsp:Transcript_16833/g.46700  ORF Transcript_16833/g.46700 Transcript_16833/m.46700 type:complete len:292 (+) Transcript_16833:726-1601(+)